jgi:two-component system OmpR family sensor kinase
MLALFTVMAVVTGAASVASLGQFLTGQMDDQLRASLGRFTGPSAATQGDDGVLPSTTGRRGPGDEGLLVIIGQDAADNKVVQYRVTTPGGSQATITADQVDALENAGLGREAKDIDLGGTLGVYRVMAGASGSSTIYVGLSRGRPTETVGNTLRTALIASILGLLAVGIGGAWLVKRNLRPLTRVADTATRVSQLHLSSGQVALAERVPAPYTDPHTEVGRVGLALNELLDHVDNALNARHESEQRVRQFVADASHELRTPLASIRGYAELTKREPEPVPESVTHALGRVESEAKRMSTLVDDLLLLARIDAGRPLDRNEVDLTELIVNAVSDAHAASPDHQWTLDLPEEPVVVRGDKARLHQIVANLLANARVHTAPGTLVRTSLDQRAGQVRIAVQDNGPGVPAELQANVFQRFARGDSSRNRAAGSTGLGLSIVAAVASAHGGRVELTSSPGDTTFAVLLPAQPAGDGIPTLAPGTAPAAAPKAPAPPMVPTR